MNNTPPERWNGYGRFFAVPRICDYVPPSSPYAPLIEQDQDRGRMRWLRLVPPDNDRYQAFSVGIGDLDWLGIVWRMPMDDRLLYMDVPRPPTYRLHAEGVFELARYAQPWDRWRWAVSSPTITNRDLLAYIGTSFRFELVECSADVYGTDAEAESACIGEIIDRWKQIMEPTYERYKEDVPDWALHPNQIRPLDP